MTNEEKFEELWIQTWGDRRFEISEFVKRMCRYYYLEAKKEDKNEKIEST